jgi:short-subunit dehydrogenase
VLDLAGKTALVTGASAGIGQELARVLAREVVTLVLVARRRDRLEALSDELRSAWPRLRVLVRDVDVSDRRATQAMLDELAAEGEVIDVLINNAGLGDYGLFEYAEWSKLERMLEVNVVGATFLLNRVVPSMVERGFGAILNVGSFAGIVPSPGMGVYSATKAYVNHLSACLSAELAGTGVSVTVLCPGPVETEFQAVAGTGARPPMPRSFYVDVTACAEEAVQALKRRKARLIPGAAVKVAALSIEALPKAVLRPVLARTAKRIRN